MTFPRAELLEKETPQGWHVFTPRHEPGTTPTLWRCVRCHGFVSHPTEWRLLGNLCREFLIQIPRQSSPAHDFAPPPGQQRLLL